VFKHIPTKHIPTNLNPKKGKSKMDITAQIRNTVRNALPSFLNANAPIRNIEAKASLLKQLGFTSDQFGFTDSGVSKIEILIGNEFFRLKKMGQVEQDGWIWKVCKKLDEQVQVVEENPMVMAVVDEIQEEETAVQETAPVSVPVSDVLVNPSNRLLSCEGYRNSLIESMGCFGNYDKKECNGCLLAYWCSPFTTQKKEDKKADRQAKKLAKTAKESLLEKYADKKESLSNLLSLINNAVSVTNKSGSVTYCMFNSVIPIQVDAPCFYVKNFGLISKEIYDEIKQTNLQ
jgi:hypothetical protein